jgi:hypothetical protein
MHSGFLALREALSMDFARSLPPPPLDATVQAQIARIQAAWGAALGCFGTREGFLFGRFSIADCYVCARRVALPHLRVKMSPDVAAYARRMMATPAMQAWRAGALQEIADGLLTNGKSTWSATRVDRRNAACASVHHRELRALHRIAAKTKSRMATIRSRPVQEHEVFQPLIGIVGVVDQDRGATIDEARGEPPVRPDGVVAEIGRDALLALEAHAVDELEAHVLRQHRPHRVESCALKRST